MNLCSRMSRALAVSAALFGSQVFADEIVPEPLRRQPHVTIDNRGLPLETFGSVTLPGQHLWANTPQLGAAQLIGQIEVFELAVETPTQAAPTEFTLEIMPFAPVNKNGTRIDNASLPLQTFGTINLPRISRSSTEPTLGEPQSLGWLPSLAELKAQGVSSAELEVLGLNEEEAYLGPPILLASLEDDITDITDIATAIPASDPEQIQHHLQLAIRLLANAGLSEQAQDVRSVLDEFRSNHRDRLALNKKRAELASLQAEIAQLSQQLALENQQLTIELKICEVDKDALGETPRSLTTAEFKKLHEEWAAKQVINPLSNPKVRTLNCQQAEIYVGAQQKVTGSDVNAQPGISVSLTPTILDDRRVLAEITSQRTEVAGSEKRPVVSRSKIQTESELSLGHVVWFSLGECATDSSKVAIVWAALTDIGPLQTAHDVDHQSRGVTPTGFSAPK